MKSFIFNLLFGDLFKHDSAIFAAISFISMIAEMFAYFQFAYPKPILTFTPLFSWISNETLALCVIVPIFFISLVLLVCRFVRDSTYFPPM